jgi:hypothetical protein
VTSIPALIDMYGRRPVDAVEQDPEYRRLCAANDSVALFHQERRRVRDLKIELEKRAGIQSTRQKQVKFALKLLLQLTGSRNQETEIAERLTRLAYYPAWTTQQKEFFDNAVDRLGKGRDYFLSFTRRKGNFEANPVNSLHCYLIRQFGYLQPQESTDNLLAAMIHRFLKSSKYQFRGFFFPDHENDSKIVDVKLRNALENSTTFVQVIQNEMFSQNYDEAKNYCLQEYMKAADLEKNMLFVFADGTHPDDFIQRDQAYFSYLDWHDRVSGTDCVFFAPTRTAIESDNVITNIALLRNKLVEGLERIREAVWDKIPNDL